jgi:hypothetical protein
LLLLLLLLVLVHHMLILLSSCKQQQTAKGLAGLPSAVRIMALRVPALEMWRQQRCCLLLLLLQLLQDLLIGPWLLAVLL